MKLKDKYMPGKLWVVPKLHEVATLKDRMEQCIPGVKKIKKCKGNCVFRGAGSVPRINHP
jgi:hypothetical protein